MCVLTFIPTGNNGFILTSNRDEAVARTPAVPPRRYNINGKHVFFPKDPQGGGTWIASSGELTLCLLNGGLKKHVPKPPYRQSRGKVILDFFDFSVLDDFIKGYDFKGIEPFTLVIIQSSDELRIDELRWDETQLVHTKTDPSRSHIWSSATLYSPQVIQNREQWFNDFLPQATDSEKILDFHLTSGLGDVRDDIRMNRDNILMTISTAQYVINKDFFTIYYQDLMAERKYNFRVMGR